MRFYTLTTLLHWFFFAVLEDARRHLEMLLANRLIPGDLISTSSDSSSSPSKG